MQVSFTVQPTFSRCLSSFAFLHLKSESPTENIMNLSLSNCLTSLGNEALPPYVICCTFARARYFELQQRTNLFRK